MLTLLLPLLAQATVEPPRTVNGIELGDAEEFVTPGPATICMREMVISPREGEKAYLAYSGIHNGGIRLVLADGEYVDFTLGEIFRDLRRPDQGPTIRKDEMRVYFFESGPDLTYQAFAIPEWEEADGRWQPLVNVTGTALAGNRSDHPLFERLSFNWDTRASCDRRYDFGWGVLLEGDPIDVTNAQ